MKAEKIILTVDRSVSSGTLAGSEAMAGSEMVALVTVAIALLALIASFYFGWLQRRHFRLSSKALIDFNYSTDGTLLELENHGFGPATLTKFTAKVDGEKPLNLMDAAGVEAYATALLRGVHAVGDHHVASLAKDSFVGAGRKYPIVTIQRPLTTEERQVIFANFKTINVRATYKCIYGKASTINLRGFA